MTNLILILTALQNFNPVPFTLIEWDQQRNQRNKENTIATKTRFIRLMTYWLKWRFFGKILTSNSIKVMDFDGSGACMGGDWHAQPGPNNCLWGVGRIGRFLAIKMLPGGAVHDTFPQWPFCDLKTASLENQGKVLPGGAVHDMFPQGPFCGL